MQGHGKVSTQQLLAPSSFPAALPLVTFILISLFFPFLENLPTHHATLSEETPVASDRAQVAEEKQKPALRDQVC